MESSTDLCFGAGKMAAKRCKAKQTGLQAELERAVMAQGSGAGSSREPADLGTREIAR
jgi:hypothetical protein